MNRATIYCLFATTAATLAAGTGLTACGRIGPLDQPPPMFGARAKAAYYAQRSAPAQAGAANTRDQTGSAERTVSNQDDATTNVTGASTGGSDPNADDAPLTTRDVRDPGQVMSTPRNSPVPGAPNSMGPTPSTAPPGA